MRFLFRLDLSLHAGAGIFFGILNYATKQAFGYVVDLPLKSLLQESVDFAVWEHIWWKS